MSLTGVKYLCPVCSVDYKPGEPLKGVLLAKFDYDYIGKKFTKDNGYEFDS